MLVQLMSSVYDNLMNVLPPRHDLKDLVKHLHTPIKTRNPSRMNKKLLNIFLIVIPNNNNVEQILRIGESVTN